MMTAITRSMLGNQEELAVEDVDEVLHEDDEVQVLKAIEDAVDGVVHEGEVAEVKDMEVGPAIEDADIEDVVDAIVEEVDAAVEEVDAVVEDVDAVVEEVAVAPGSNDIATRNAPTAG